MSFGGALRHRNFRLFFAGQSVSLIGTWMQQVALAWLVFSLTGSPWWLGVVGFCAQIPSFFFAPVAGVFVDQWNRHRLILVTQSLAMLQAIVVALLAWFGVIAVWHVIVLNLLLGLVHAFDIPARQTFLFDLVGHSEDLANAIALNSSMVNAARLLGPALAGLLLMRTSAAVCFTINAVSYLAVLASLLTIRLTASRRTAAGKQLLDGLSEGVRYAFGSPPIRALLVMASSVSFLGASYIVLLPVFATRVLHGSADALGFLHSAAGLGALLAAFLLAMRKDTAGLGEWIAAAPAILGLGLIGFSFSRWFWLSFALVFVNGFAVMTHMAGSNTLLQSIVDKGKRGRVMSLYTVAFMGTLPLGSLMSGLLADLVSAPITVRLGGLCCIVGSLVFFIRLHRFRAMLQPVQALPAENTVSE